MNDRDFEVELLAPAGKEGSVEVVLAAGADAVYLGGKHFNMRTHFRRFNYTDPELEASIAEIHARGARAYVVVNSLLATHELDELADYLNWLVSAGADAFILQDLAVIRLVHQLDLQIPLHASTMMNVNSAETARELADLGVSRIVLSRDITLEAARAIREATGMEIEYFIHGDMCIAQSGQCFHSGILLGHSSNRGRCMKACRWQWELIDRATDTVRAMDARGSYLLARRDMAMYTHLPELLRAGVCSLKIEGRMRTASVLGPIVGAYREALDRYRSDPAGYDIDPAEWKAMVDRRIRDFSTCNAFCSPGIESTAPDGEREPRFFSRGTRERPLDPGDLPALAARGPERSSPANRPDRVLLAVRVADEAGLQATLRAGADRVLAGGDIMRGRTRPWSLAGLGRLDRLVAGAGREWGLLTPRLADPRQLDDLAHQLAHLEARPAGVAVHSLGALRLVREAGFSPWADFSFNTMNRAAAELLADRGARQVTLALEAGHEDLATVSEAEVPVECLAQGPVPAMLLDYCVIAALELGISRHDACPAPCFDGARALRDTAGGVHDLLVDQYCRTTLLMTHDLALLPVLDLLCARGTSVVRLDLHDTPPDRVEGITALYRRHLDRCLAARGGPCSLPSREWEELQELCTRPLNTGAFLHGVAPPHGSGHGQEGSTTRFIRPSSCRSLGSRSDGCPGSAPVVADLHGPGTPAELPGARQERA